MCGSCRVYIGKHVVVVPVRIMYQSINQSIIYSSCKCNDNEFDKVQDVTTTVVKSSSSSSIPY